MERETIEYRGKNYHRYPDSERAQHRNYFYRHGAGDTSPVALHRQIYEDNNGPIPKGMDIHHRDHDFDNNSPENFKCLTKTEHRIEHPMSDEEKARRSIDGKENNKLTKWQRENPELAAKNWSERGKNNTGLADWKKDNPELASKVYSEAGKKSNGNADALHKWRAENPELAKAAGVLARTKAATAPRKEYERTGIKKWRIENPELARQIASEAGRRSGAARRAKRESLQLNGG